MSKKRLYLVGVAIFCVFAYGFYYLGGGKEKAAAEEAERVRVADSARVADSTAAAEKAAAEAARGPVYNSSWDGSVTQVKDYLKAVLNDPKSYDPAEWGTVMKADGKPYRFVVAHKYRAKNGFGALTLQYQKFYLDSVGTVVNVEDLM